MTKHELWKSPKPEIRMTIECGQNPRCPTGVVEAKFELACFLHSSFNRNSSFVIRALPENL
jgi:hypothetical protein